MASIEVPLPVFPDVFGLFSKLHRDLNKRWLDGILDISQQAVANLQPQVKSFALTPIALTRLIQQA